MQAEHEVDVESLLLVGLVVGIHPLHRVVRVVAGSHASTPMICRRATKKACRCAGQQGLSKRRQAMGSKQRQQKLRR